MVKIQENWEMLLMATKFGARSHLMASMACLCFLLPDILQDEFAHHSHWTLRIEYVEDNVWGVDDLVELAVDMP